MDNVTSAPGDLEAKLKLLEEQNKQLDRDAKIILQHDIQIREAYDELDREKTNISSERNKLSVVLQSISDAVIAVDVETKILTFNKAAEVLMDIKSIDAIGKNLDEIFQLFEDERKIEKGEYCPIQLRVTEEMLFQKNNLTLLNKANQKKSVNIIVRKVEEASKVKVGAILTFHDISKERELETMKIDFVSMAAHELRTPLTVVRGYASMLSDEVGKVLTDQQKEYMNRMTISIDTLGSLINNLLNVSRIERNALKLNMGVVNLEEVVKKTIDELSNSATTKKQHLVYEKGQDSFGSVIADSFRIGEVLTNLIGNAITYTPPDGTITVGLTQKDKALEVTVKDTGQGIPEDAIPKLFSKFFRVSGALEQGSKGTGLGLYISKSIIDMHKGEIGVESKVGEGSRFYFVLPLATDEEKAVLQNSLPESPTFGIIMNKERSKPRSSS